MRNGGGPACLRLRVALTDAEAAAMHQGVIMTEALYAHAGGLGRAHYRDRSSRKTWPIRSWRSNARRAGRAGAHPRPAGPVRFGLKYGHASLDCTQFETSGIFGRANPVTFKRRFAQSHKPRAPAATTLKLLEKQQ
jgi:hypothetical protein